MLLVLVERGQLCPTYSHLDFGFRCCAFLLNFIGFMSLFFGWKLTLIRRLCSKDATLLVQYLGYRYRKNQWIPEGRCFFFGFPKKRSQQNEDGTETDFLPIHRSRHLGDRKYQYYVISNTNVSNVTPFLKRWFFSRLEMNFVSFSQFCFWGYFSSKTKD